MRVAGDSVPPLRLLVLGDLLTHPDSTTSDVTRRLQRPRTTVDRSLQELHLLGLVCIDEVEGQKSWRYRLTPGVDLTTLEQLITRNVSTHTRTEEERDQPHLGTDKSGDVGALTHVGTDKSGDTTADLTDEQWLTEWTAS